MTTVKEIYEFLNEKFPIELACDFDNPGLLIGDPCAEVKKALVVLDCDAFAVKYAVLNGCELIITHHPIIFGGLKNILADCVQYELIKNGISVISMHTNLDVGNGGVNDCLCKALGLNGVSTVTASNGFLLRMGTIPPISADGLAEKIKKSLGGCVKYTDCGKRIEKVLVCSGSGGEFADDALRLNCDALITADVKHNVFIDSSNAGLSVFDAGHFNTEDTVIEPLKDILAEHFTDTEFISSHHSEIKYR